MSRFTSSKRAVVAVQTAVMSTVLLGFAAFAIDTGRLYCVRTELQRTADAAAMAAVSGLASDGRLTGDDALLARESLSRATALAQTNHVLQTDSHLAEQDVEFGVIVDPNNLQSPFLPASASAANAVRVTVRRSSGSIDGPIPLMFAGVLGKRSASVVATATALLDTRFVGFRPPANGEGVLLPLTILEGIYRQELITARDDYGYASDTDTVEETSDGIGEVWLYPRKVKVDGSVDGAGNFGVLNVGVNNLGTADVVQQILHGITPEQMTTAIGQPDIRFVDETGSPVAHVLGGNTGISAGIKSALEQRIGDVVGFFIHRTFVDPGANCQFTVVNIRFGRIVQVDFTGSPTHKALVLQPVAYAGSGVITDPGAPPSMIAGSVRLVR